MTLPPSPTAAAVLLAQARARFRHSVARAADALHVGAATLAGDPTDAATIEAICAEMCRVTTWADTFELTSIALVSAALAARTAHWANDPEAEPVARPRIVRDTATLLAAILAECVGEGDVARAEDARPDAGPAIGAVLDPAPADAPVDAWDAMPDVVIVEDEPAMTRLLAFGLEQSGLRTAAFDSGAAALAALREMPARGGRPLVLLDVELPGMDGHAVHEQLETERPGAFSFVFTSGRISEGEQVRAISGGALDYVVKPISLRVLMAKVPRWLAAGAASHAMAQATRTAA